MTVDLAGPRATAEATLTAACTITADRAGTLNTTTGKLEPDEAIYSGPCSVRGEVLLLPADVDPPVGAVVAVTASDDDSQQTRTYTITDVARSSRVVLRRCTIAERGAL